MSLPIVLSAASAGLSILGDMAGNSAIAEAAKGQYDSNKLFIERDQAIANTQTMYKGQELNNQLGLELTNLLLQANRAKASQTTRTAETMAYGNVAARSQDVIAIKQALSEDSLVQAAEAKMTDIQAQLSNIKYATESKHVQNKQNYNQMMSNQKSTFDILVGGVSAGISGYSLGTGIEATQAQSEFFKQRTNILKGSS